MDKKIKEMMHFALRYHKNRYDYMPYTAHLELVVRYIKKYLYLLPKEDHELAIICGWGHDTIEDTNKTYNDIKKIFGSDVAEYCFLLANFRGRNRKERACLEYYQGIKLHKITTYVKICDRLANLSYSYYTKSNMVKMYQKEMDVFKMHLYDDDFIEMWDELENFKEPFINVYYPDVVKFDSDSIFKIKLPTPIPYDLYYELHSKGIIKKSDLKINCYYKGKSRNGKVAVWNGQFFVYMRNKFGKNYPENINHLVDDNGFDLFIPLEETKPTDEQIVKYI